MELMEVLADRQRNKAKKDAEEATAEDETKERQERVEDANASADVQG